jgi:hypothetical protein
VNSPILVVPKKAGPDGNKKWRMVVSFRKLNEKANATNAMEDSTGRVRL